MEKNIIIPNKKSYLQHASQTNAKLGLPMVMWNLKPDMQKVKKRIQFSSFVHNLMIRCSKIKNREN